MNFTTHDASLYLHKIAGSVKTRADVEVVLAPTLLAIQSLSLQINRRQFKLAVQNLYYHDHGAYTGEVSAAQLRGIADYAIIGHSERRHIFHETDKDIRSKVQAALRSHIKPVLCIGETAQEKADGETRAVLHDQLVGGLANVTSEEIADVTIAYEPVWAISNGSDFGTHETATPQSAQEAATLIRKQVASLYGKSAGEAVRVIYGASISSTNAQSYMIQDDIDGLLIGGASLIAPEFAQIVTLAHGVKLAESKQHKQIATKTGVGK